MAAAAAAIAATSILSPKPPCLLLLASDFRGATIPFSTNPNHHRLLHFRLRSRAAVTITAEALPTCKVQRERFRLDNLGPQPGSRKKAKRKGRGIAAGQGASCGFGMRGQKSRSGPGVRRGFEGGQMPLYRRLPKLRGIAGGMPSGLPKFVPVNLKDIASAGFEDGDEVSLESLKARRLINPSGRERKLPLKILGDGDLTVKLNFKAQAFSAGAKEKIEASGCTLTVLPGKKKWLPASVTKNRARMEEYMAKKKGGSSSSSDASS